MQRPGQRGNNRLAVVTPHHGGVVRERDRNVTRLYFGKSVFNMPKIVMETTEAGTVEKGVVRYRRRERAGSR